MPIAESILKLWINNFFITRWNRWKYDINIHFIRWYVWRKSNTYHTKTKGTHPFISIITIFFSLVPFKISKSYNKNPPTWFWWFSSLVLSFSFFLLLYIVLILFFFFFNELVLIHSQSYENLPTWFFFEDKRQTYPRDFGSSSKPIKECIEGKKKGTGPIQSYGIIVIFCCHHSEK